MNYKSNCWFYFIFICVRIQLQLLILFNLFWILVIYSSRYPVQGWFLVSLRHGLEPSRPRQFQDFSYPMRPLTLPASSQLSLPASMLDSNRYLDGSSFSSASACSAARLPAASLPWSWQALSNACHTRTPGRNGTREISSSASSIWPAFPSRSTMQA